MTFLNHHLYKSTKEKNWQMCPYVNFEESSPKNGWDGDFMIHQDIAAAMQPYFKRWIYA